MGSALYWMGADVHGPRYGWSMRQASAMLLVPDRGVSGTRPPTTTTPKLNLLYI